MKTNESIIFRINPRNLIIKKKFYILKMEDKMNRETSKELKGGGGCLKAKKNEGKKKVVKYDNMTTTCIKIQNDRGKRYTPDLIKKVK
jgi:hypothetical protein